MNINIDRFRNQLERQLGFLARSCCLYDQGYPDEAIRIATTIRVLIHDTPKSTSLLTYLNARNINLFTTYPEPPKAEEGFIGVTAFNMGIIKLGRGYGPNLEDFSSSSEALPVDRWWDQVVWMLRAGVKLTRKDIVLAAANQDGGAHVDNKLLPGYEELAYKAWGTLITKKGDKEYKNSVINMHLVAIRTMGNELLKSPELLSLVGYKNHPPLSVHDETTKDRRFDKPTVSLGNIEFIIKKQVGGFGQGISEYPLDKPAG